MKTNVFDKNGTEVQAGDTIRESHTMIGKSGEPFEFDVSIGKVKIVRGCHVIDFGVMGAYSFYERYPENGIQNRIWEVIAEAQAAN